MRRILLLAALLGASSPAAATTADTNLENALLVEWMVAHCDQSKIPAANVGVAQMVINGSDEDAVKAKRAFIKKGVADNYSGQDDACSQLIAGFK
jgi:hypothetical protein